MQKNEHHLSDDNLLLAADNELSPRNGEEALAHLARCPACRKRLEKLEAFIAEFGRARRDDMNGGLVAAPSSRATLQGKLEALSRGTRPTPRAGRISDLFSGQRWVYVAAAFLIAAIGLRSLTREIRQDGSESQSFAADSVPLLPEPKFTPGATRAINVSQVCTPGPSDQMATIPMDVRQTVFHEYGMDRSRPREYEVDHLITPELGGTDDIRNLWPEPYASTEWNAHVKDELESHLRQLVCDGKLDLPTAQRDISTNWISAYQKYFHTEKPLSNVSTLIWARESGPNGDLWAELILLAASYSQPVGAL